MEASSKNIQKEAEYYLSIGVSVIPVRDKPQEHNGHIYSVKSAYPWAKWQKSIITPEELLFNMTDKYDTMGYGLVCGQVSGNLEVIDIDVKNWPGIETLIFADIKALLPHIFPLLRIHQTTSKGYHILYRISDHAPEGNLKLAYKEGTKEAAIETRGEGGYIVASSAMNYIPITAAPIPVITWTERCSLINICKGYNEKIKPIITAPSKAQTDYYDESPFDAYNNSTAGQTVLLNNGWKFEGESSNYIYYTRPGKTSGTSASFSRDRKVFHIFTSSTDFEPDKSYLPATALAILMFNGDKKQLYVWLVDNGFGRVKPAREKKLAASCARKGKEVPANFSDEAKGLAVSISGELESLHPFGTFWFYNDDNDVTISRENIGTVAGKLGFRYRLGNAVRIVGQFLYKVEEREFQDILKDYIHEPEPAEYEKIANAYEAFMQRNGKYTMQRLEILDTTNILHDTADCAYKFYQNGYLAIDIDAIQFLPYSTLADALIWSDKIQQRDYQQGNGGVYLEFLRLATDPAQADHIARVLGYLSHEYKDETTGYIIVLTEQCVNPKDGGGSGKNIFAKLLENTTTYTSKPGSQTKFDEKFFQSWNRQKIFTISDVSKNFDFSFLKEPATGSFIWKKLFKDEIEVANEDAPKFVVLTNYSYEITDGGLRRRIIPIEFTNFFTIAGGLDVHFGCHFPRGWTSTDWAGFDNYIASAIQKWLRAGRKLTAPALTEGGWMKQFEQTYGTVLGLIQENWEEWCKRVEVGNEQFKTTLTDYYRENNIPVPYQPSMKKINAGLKEWGRKYAIEVKVDQLKKVNGISARYRYFLGEVPF